MNVTARRTGRAAILRPAENPEVALAVRYASAHAHAALSALIALDDTLAAVLRTTGEPALMQIRLHWWRDALVALDRSPPPATPILVAVSEALVGEGVSGATLAAMVDGWDILVEADALDDVSLERFAAARGGTLFAAAARRIGDPAALPVAAAGAGWALADLARHLSDPAVAARSAELAAPQLKMATGTVWPRAFRAVGALAHLARLDLSVPLDRTPPYGAPSRVARLAWHRLSGR